MRKVAVVGASLSGLRAAESALRSGYEGEIVLFGDEVHLPYNRPPLSKEALEHSAELSSVLLRSSFKDRISYKLETKIQNANLATGEIVTDAGESYRFDAIVAASGLRSRGLKIPKPTNGVFTLRRFDDMVAIRTALATSKKIAIIGAGFVGCELASTFTRLGHQVTIIAPEPCPMLRPLGKKLGASLLEHHAKAGVEFALNRLPIEIAGADCPVSVVCDDGTVVESDVVIEAVGSTANTEWLEGNDLDLSDGVVCNEFLQTGDGVPLFVVGDIAKFPNLLFDQVPRRVEHWGIAVDSGRYAGKSLAKVLQGELLEEPFRPLPAFWSDQFDLRIQSFGMPGLTSDESSIEVLEGDLNSEVSVGYYRGDTLVGVVMIGMASSQGKYRNLVLDSLTN